MIHVIYGDNRFLGLEEVEAIVSKYCNFERNDFLSSQASFDMDAVLEAASTISMFYDQRLVFLHVESDKDLVKIIPETMEQIFNIKDVIFIIWLPKKLEAKHKLSKILKKADHTHSLQKDKEAQGTLIKRLDGLLKEKGLDLSYEAKQALIKNLGEDYMRLEAEVDKLVLLNKTIEVSDINAMIAQDLSKDVFSLGNALIAKNKKEAFRIYHDLLAQKQEPLSLLALIGSSLRSIYQIETLKHLNFSEQAIIKQLRMSSGQYWYINKNQVGRLKNVLGAMNTLATIDQGVKLGTVDAYVAFEVFMLRLMS